MGLTQKQLAYKTYYSYEFIRKIESTKSCRNTFSLATIEAIANALEIDVYLLFIEEKKQDTKEPA